MADFSDQWRLFRISFGRTTAEIRVEMRAAPVPIEEQEQGKLAQGQDCGNVRDHLSQISSFSFDNIIVIFLRISRFPFLFSFLLPRILRFCALRRRLVFLAPRVLHV
jgi:hypothetical protein